METVVTKSPEETHAIAATFIQKHLLSLIVDSLPSSPVFCLQGDLGSGKTTFMKGVGEALGIKETIASPTFVIEKAYKITGHPFERLIHIDAYRLSGGEELMHLGFDEILKNPRHLVFIEWPENVEKVLPENHATVHFRFIDENTREVKFEE